MKERPILFSGAMVRAILSGAKSQTLLVVKLPERSSLRGTWEPTTIGGDDGNNVIHDDQVAIWHTGTGDVICCPYGKPGDQLWVRETFCHLPEYEGLPAETYYKADGDDGMRVPETISEYRWKPSIHMPRNLSRILLEVVSVRVERLQDISEADAIAEGCDDSKSNAAKSVGWCEKPRRAFQRLWEHINGQESWNANSWVWVVEFRRVQP